MAKEKIFPKQVSDKDVHLVRLSAESISSRFKRNTTDILCLLFMGVSVAILGCLLFYCYLNSDIYRIINGYDNCGYVCGRISKINRQVYNKSNLLNNCKSIDQRKNSFHIVFKNQENTKHKDRMCVSNCSKYQGYKEFLNRCIPVQSKNVVNTIFSKSGLKNFFEEVSEDFQLCWREFIYLCLISFGLSVLLLILFRFLVGYVVWLVLCGVILSCCIGTIYLWLKWGNVNISGKVISDITSRKSTSYLVFSIASTLVTAVVMLIIFVLRKRIQLVVQLFKESGKALTSMPLLLFQPIETFICLVAVLSLCFYICLCIESSGFLTQVGQAWYYQKNTVIKVTRWFNLLMMLWATQFIIGCQHMIIAGAVSSWYFKRNKWNANFPIFKSFYTLTRYHLGSVALGSFLIAIIQWMRIIFKFIRFYTNRYNGKWAQSVSKCCSWFLYCFEKIIKYLGRNAYIEVAMHSHTFCYGGKQAFKLLVNNALRVTAINSVGDFTLFLGKVLVVMATAVIGVKILHEKQGIQHIWVPVTFAAIFAYFVAHCFLTVYEMTIDTIFLCFCEDCEENNGTTKPYFMSRGLMNFVESSKRSEKIQAVNSTQLFKRRNIVASDLQTPSNKSKIDLNSKLLHENKYIPF